uniref:uncharacterized protein LOC122583563 n=1 Tax=Erigeron canadensis TaxID=72917 RepID=UPI001CB8C698|nr:uncharacterized protein LOC122583563 [Erigeron canadensis]
MDPRMKNTNAMMQGCGRANRNETGLALHQQQPARPQHRHQPIARQPQPLMRPHRHHVVVDPFHASGSSSQQYYRPEPITPLTRNSISQPNQSESYSLDNFVLPGANEFNPITDFVQNGVLLEGEHEEDAMPETQMEDPLDNEVQEIQAQDIGVPKRIYRNRAPKQPWSSGEEETLAQAWIQISTCKQIGNEQNASFFWKRVSEHFNKTMGNENRTHYPLTTKWRELNGALGLFNGLHHQVTRLWQSGCNDLDVFNNACELFKKKNDKDFTHNRAWEVVKKHAKWLEQKNVQDELSNHDKRRKSIESGQYESTSNDDPILPNLNEDSSPPIDNRSIKGKKPVGESSSKSSVNNIVQEYTTKKAQLLDENALLHQKAYEKYIEEKEEKKPTNRHEATK